MNAKEAAERFAEIAEEHPDAEVRIDPPYSRVLSILYRKRENVVEITH